MRYATHLIASFAPLLLAGASGGVALAADDGGPGAIAEPVIRSIPVATSPGYLVPAKADSIGASNVISSTGVLDKIAFATESRVGQGDGIGELFDEIYGATNAGRNRSASFSTSSSVSAGIGDVTLDWSLGDLRLDGFEVLAGVRYFDTTFDFKFLPANRAKAQSQIKVSEALTDLMIGARYTAELSDHWAVTFRGDGGFGDTDSNYGASVALKYRTASSMWLIGFQYMDTRFNSGARTVDFATFGPVIGYTFKF